MYLIKDKKTIESLFNGWEETLIWSCLQDYMGVAYAPMMENAESAGILVADFCFLAGKPNRAVAEYKPEGSHSDIIMVPQTVEWEKLIEDIYGSQAERITRYATKKEKDVFDVKKLQTFSETLQPPYELHTVNAEIFKQMKENEWAVDLCAQFSDYEEYEQVGLGVVVLKSGELVAGASSYTVYQDGIEIEIDTRKDERRKGLALACAAKLILECLARGKYPSWDAHNRASLALAEKLGYHFDKEYIAYEICNCST